MSPEFVLQIREIVTALENDDRVKVVVFESAVDGFFLNHSDFLAKFEDLTSIPQGPTGLEAWPDVLVRLTRAPFVSIALIRGRATGNGSELALACDMSFASREKAVLSQFEVGVGLVAGGGPMARLPRVMGRGRALGVLLSADDIRGADAELLGYVNRALPDAELNYFVDALATRIASFDKWAIANTKRLVNEASLPPDVEIRAGWDACMASVKRPAAQERIKALLAQGLQKPGDSENRLGFYVGQLGLGGGPATEPVRPLSQLPVDNPLPDKERNPMVKQASNVRKRLRRFLTADPGRFAGGSAVSDPLGLLAVERERHANVARTAGATAPGSGRDFSSRS
jgi:enoyl-CoA hydratase/carnithine racemase